MTEPDVSIIIVTYNCASYVRRCVQCALDQTGVSIEVLVVDNNSSDSTPLILREFEAKVKLVSQSRNIGLAPARNLVAGLARGRVLCFLDADVFLEKDAVLQALRKLDWKTGCVYGKNLVVDRPELVLAIGLDRRGWHFDEPASWFTDEVETLYALGGFFLMPRSVWDAIGGYDENYFFGWEEVDLGWRTWMKGYRVVFEPSAVCYHIGKTIRNDPRLRSLASYHELKGFTMTLLKDLEGWLLGLLAGAILIRIIVFAFSAAVRFRTVRGMGAFRWVIRNSRTIFRERARTQSTRRISDVHLLDRLVYLIFPIDTLRQATDVLVSKFR